MYSVHAYYLAALTMSFTLVWFYPLLVAFPTFYVFQLQSDSFTDLLYYAAVLSVTAISGSFFGFMLGCFIRSETIATEVCSLFIIIFNLGAGCYANASSNANIFVKILTHISPLRYAAELTLRRITDGRSV